MPPIRARDAACEAWNDLLKEEFLRKGFYHSIPLPDGTVLEGIIPLEALEAREREFPLPARLDGKRVLDIGTWDGYFAFAMERRGAEVVAIDSTEQENFRVARELLGSRVDYRVQDVYELSPERNGMFDVVLFMGVLYHLKHPLLGLERVCSVTRDVAIVESFVTTEAVTGALPVLEFYETNELLGQFDNWCGPNAECLLAFCRVAGFARQKLIRITGQRAVVACYRHWEAEPEEAAVEAPRLLACTHASNYGVNVSRAKDDYITAFFKSGAETLTCETVFPEVGGFGVYPVGVQHTGGDGWQASFRIPPGLDAGWQPVRLRTAGSRYSEAVRVAVDVPAVAEFIRLEGACDSETWRPGEVASGTGKFLSIWARGLPVNADRGNLRVTLGGKRLTVEGCVVDGKDASLRQVNARVPDGFPRGRYELVVGLGEVRSEGLSVRVV
jgi:tRNA (mo5U34)-methyltransferase